MKILVPSPVFRMRNFAKYTRSNHANVNKGMSNKIRDFDTLERQTMGVNKYASTFPMPSCNKKRCDHRKKTWRRKNMKIRNCFCKYAIDDNQVA